MYIIIKNLILYIHSFLYKMIQTLFLSHHCHIHISPTPALTSRLPTSHYFWSSL